MRSTSFERVSSKVAAVFMILMCLTDGLLVQSKEGRLEHSMAFTILDTCFGRCLRRLHFI